MKKIKCKCVDHLNQTILNILKALLDFNIKIISLMLIF